MGDRNDSPIAVQHLHLISVHLGRLTSTHDELCDQTPTNYLCTVDQETGAILACAYRTDYLWVTRATVRSSVSTTFGFQHWTFVRSLCSEVGTGRDER